MDYIKLMQDVLDGRRSMESLSPEDFQHMSSPAAKQEQLLHLSVDVDVCPFYDAQGVLRNLHSVWVNMFGRILVPPADVRAAGKEALIAWVKTALAKRAEALTTLLERDANACVEDVNTKVWKSSKLPEFKSWTCGCKRCKLVRTGLAGDTSLAPNDVCRVYGCWLPLLGRMEESEMLGHASGSSHGLFRNRGAPESKVGAISIVQYRDTVVPIHGFGRALVVPLRAAVLGDWPTLHRAGKDIGSSPGILFFELAKALEGACPTKKFSFLFVEVLKIFFMQKTTRICFVLRCMLWTAGSYQFCFHFLVWHLNVTCFPTNR